MKKEELGSLLLLAVVVNFIHHAYTRRQMKVGYLWSIA
jgi:hypothetical protein